MKNKRGLAAISSGLTVLLLAAVVATGSRAVPSVSAAEEPLYMFNVIGDMQMGDPNCYDEENYKAALEDIKSISPETKAILTVGDHTNNGSEAEYKTLNTIKNDILPDVPVYYTIGNHDRAYTSGYGNNNTKKDVWMDRFIEYAKLSSGNDSINNVYYSFQLEGSYVIVLGSEVTSRNDNCNDVYISEEQYNWFTEQMETAAKTEKPIFVLIHEPFPNTVSGSLPGQGWEGNPKDPDYYPENKYGDLKAVADKYPQTVVFSGHTHWEFASKQPAVISNGKTSASYFNCSAVGYIWNDNNQGYMQNGKYTGSEGLYVYVYSDKIVVKGRDFANEKWLIEKTISLTGESAGDPSDATPGTNPDTKDDNNTTWIIIGVCAVTLIVVAIAIGVVVSSKKKKGNEK
ncbi:MAG: metallophosphoesterase family protein [Clostridia bacterium]